MSPAPARSVEDGYECERDSDKCIQSLFWLRPTHSRFTSNCGLTEVDTARPCQKGIHNLLRQAASFDIHQTDTGPANFMDVELIPLCGSGTPKNGKWLTTSEPRITRDGDPMHTPPLARIIVERAVLGAAVVPDRQRTNLPAESAGKLRLHGMRRQKIENRPRLGALEPFERLRVIAYVERFAAGLRMGADKRKRGFGVHGAGGAHLGCHLHVAGITAVFGRIYLVVPVEYPAVSDIAGLDALEHLFHRIG